MAKVVKSQAKSGISEDALIWVQVRKILNKKGIDAALQALKEIREKQNANQEFATTRAIRLG